ncbi:MAG: PD40 domain-containing protein [Acidobacteria bacterium]|nr:PD40 domain-containing protein [Acidobacteriota bacterium]
MIRYVLFASALLTAAPKPVFTDGAVTLLGTPSTDGRLISLVEHGNLAVRDIATGRSSLLTQAKGKEFAYFSAISRDSKSVAYAWFNEEGFYELRAIPAAGGQPRTLFKNPEAGFVQPCAWTPGDKFILTLLFRKDNVSQIALIPAAGGEAKVLRSLNWVYPKRMDISPDGQTLIYDSFAPGSTSQRTIYSLTLDGAAEKRLVNEPGNHLFPLYAPDGKSFYYLSDDDLVERTLDGPPKVIAKGLGRALPLGVTAEGKLYYGLRTGASDVFLADVRDIAKTARRASLQYPNRNLAPSFSPDGKRLAYLSRRGTENFGQESRAVVIRDLSGDAEDEQTVRMAHIERVRWRADGRALLLSGSDGRGRGGIFEFDLATKKTTPAAAEIGGPFRGYEFYPLSKGFVYVDGQMLRDEKGGEIKSDLPGLLAGFAVQAEEVTEWLPSAAGLFGIKGENLIRFTKEGRQEFRLPGNRQPGASISPDGKTIAVTAGRETQEIWVLDLPYAGR